MRFLIVFVLIAMSGELSAQYRWDWHDPLDLGVFDWGDNKLLGYNAVGVGLSLYLTKPSHLERKQFRGIDFSSYVDVLYEYSRPPKSDVFIGRLRWTKRLRRYLDVGGDLSLYKVNDSQISTEGAGVQAVFTWRLHETDDWLFYFDNGVGPNVFLDPFPFGGTRFNFTTFYGLYVAYRVPSVAWVTLGIKNIHISNADIKGRDRNPALDGLGLSLGYRFF